MKIVGTHHVALKTAHFDKLRAFYVERLGLRQVGAFRGRRIIFIDAGNTTIELIEQNDLSSGEVGAWAHFAFEVEDVDATYAELTGQGIESHVLPKDFPPDGPAVRIAFFKDPDGNEVELVQPLGSRYPTGE